MSTSDPRDTQLVEGQSPLTAREGAGFSALPADPLDPLQLARIANELFKSLPGSSVPPQAPAPDSTTVLTAPVSPPLTHPAFPSALSLPSSQDLPTLPASADLADIAPVSASAQPTPPAVPGAMGANVVEATPPFSFLQDARPIFSDRHSFSEGPYPKAAPITQIAQHSVPQASTVPSPNASDTYSFRALGALPQIPLPSTDFEPSPGIDEHLPVTPFSFLEELRPLFSYPLSIPGPAPVIPEVELASNTPLDLDLPDEFRRSPDIAELALRHSPRIFEEVRPLEPSESSLPLTLRGLEQDVPDKLDLSSYPFDVEAIKRDFPILQERINGWPLVWLDNAATTQKPQSVIDRLKYFYEHENSNVHRAAHELAARATDAYESARDKVRRFLNASSARDIILVRGATEGINLIAQSWGKRNLQKDDEIVITWLEHHANIVPWQMLCSETGAKLRVAPVDDSGQILLDEFERLIGQRTRLASFTMVSNALGIVTPAGKMVEIAHRHGAKVLVDGAQAVSHMRVDMQSLDCDFFVFSGHKVFGPTGIGAVYGKSEVLEGMPPWQGGGNMIQDVTLERTIYQSPPQRFEAGTGNIADAVGLGAAIDYLDRIGMPNISRHEHALLEQATNELIRIPGLHIIGAAKEKAGVLSFVLEGFRNEEVGDYLNKQGIAVRSGHHCAQPILRRFGYEGTVRASLALYNTHEDIDRLVAALWDLRLGRVSVA